MDFKIESILDDEKEKIYIIKKKSIKKYVDEIWGWDEVYQIKDFADSFKLSNFNKIVVKDKCIGFIEISESHSLINITEIHLVPKFQGQGIGSEVIKRVMDYAKETDKSITIGCFKKNIKALKLYKRLGFKIIKETEYHFHLESFF